MVRHAIEDIKFHGGSTLTSQAINLAIKDLSKGRRLDAIQVIVLMNDGMSQVNCCRIDVKDLSPGSMGRRVGD
jgi:hypothetical protein